MKHKLWLIMLTFVTSLCLTFSLSACGLFDLIAPEGLGGSQGGKEPETPHVHVMTEHEAKEPTCTTEGTKQYWSCSVCELNFADKEGKTQLDELSIPALGHDMTKHEAKEATETEDGNNEYWECGRCEQYFSDAKGEQPIEDKSSVVIPAKNHVHEPIRHEAQEPTCTEDGNELYFECKNCHALFLDESCTEKTTLADVQKQAMGHQAKSEWEHGEATHYHVCDVCGEKLSDTESAHTYENGKCAVCEYEHENHTYEKGKCTVCEYEHNNHAYENGKCTICEYEHENHTYKSGKCTVCEYEHKDHTYENGICTICDYEHLDHTFGAYVQNEEGHTRSCSVCHKSEGGAHNYESGICTTCEYEHQNHVFVYSEKTEAGHAGGCSVCGKATSGEHNYEKGKCTVCEYEHADHIFEYSEKTEKQHTGTCSVCFKIVTEAHKYTNGTCTDCAYEHINHSWSYSDKTEDTHRGTCEDCGKIETSDHVYKNGICVECTYEHQVHVFLGYEQNDSDHWHTCEVCHKTETEAHDYENGTCPICRHAHIGHSWNYFDSTEATHQGTCDICGKTETMEHQYEAGICTKCSYEHQGHSYSDYEKNDANHWQTCEVCNKIKKEAHDYVNGTCEICYHAHEVHSWNYSDKTESTHKRTCNTCGKAEIVQHSYNNGVCTFCQYAHIGHNYGANNMCSICGAMKPKYSRSGNKIYFGEYPQTEVTDKNDTDSSLRNSLNMAAGSTPTVSYSGKWTSYGYYYYDAQKTNYMWYIDIDYQGSRYRGVYFTSYRPCWLHSRFMENQKAQKDNGYMINTVYWFKYMPITWRILEEKSGIAVLMSNMILDSQEYYHSIANRTIGGKTVYPNNYKESDIRSWLNSTFYNTAFNSYINTIIQTTLVDNSEDPELAQPPTSAFKGTYACEDTSDKIFLLSYREEKTTYGLTVATRQMTPTDYAKSQGHDGGWLLRSPSKYSERVQYVDSDGNGSSAKEYYVSYTGRGIVPALRIKL